MVLTLDHLLESGDSDLVVTLVLFFDIVVLLFHSINLAFDLCFLYQLVYLQIHLFQPANQVEIGLLESC